MLERLTDFVMVVPVKVMILRDAVTGALLGQDRKRAFHEVITPWI
ncbi:hypothetical protein OAC78_00535 [Litorivicinus sp.]|nr:hypothetical protein [Litorivicinus sp.]